MKIAFFSESTADEAALRILVEGILQEEVESTNLPNNLLYRSSSHLDRELPVVVRGVHYNSNAEALVVVSDSDDTPVHINVHDTQSDDRCRLCQLRKTVHEIIANLRTLPIKGKLKVAVGVPVPAIEAWYLCGVNPHVNEATWIRKQSGERITYDRKRLKTQIYGTDRPSLMRETEQAIDSATRLIPILDELEQRFPQGFGNFANEVRGWKT